MNTRLHHWLRRKCNLGFSSRSSFQLFFRFLKNFFRKTCCTAKRGFEKGEISDNGRKRSLPTKVLYYNATSLLYIIQGIMSISAGKFLQYTQKAVVQRSLADGFFVRGDEKKITPSNLKRVILSFYLNVFLCPVRKNTVPLICSPFRYLPCLGS